ncbi:MAG: MobC family plasmid mobilization relaxosome protein [Pleurocapsa sp. CRU_1_2]|nr:MobC family plasmid mobilization relaxosome protein [Pleurocapsa sp. CRU_1_2]
MPKKARPIKFQLCLSKEEKIRIDSLSSETGLTPSELFRRGVFQKRLPQKVTDIAHKTYWELGQIGVNINQIARVANTAIIEGHHPLVADPTQLQKLEELLHQILREIVGCHDSEAGEG